MRILIFDSGIGGLGTAAALHPLLPHASLIYLADTAGFPYSEKPDASLTAAILRLIQTAIGALHPDLIIIACNTASTVALDALRARFTLPFIGCVPPIKWAAAISKTRVIGLLATPATIRRPYLQNLTRQYAADCTILAHGAPNLARLAEAKFRGDPIDPQTLRADLQGLINHPQYAQIDAIALGCTHYPRLLPELSAALPPHITWLDPAPRVAHQASLVAATLTPAPQPRLDGTAFFTGAPPTGAEEAAWAEAGFPHQRKMN
jgi:glutamate racemase